jgi:Primase C terminal 1 (PriCT-1)
MSDIWLPLRGPNNKGLNPKGCYEPGWNTHAYLGLGSDDLADRISRGGWVGLRLDDWIVIDCDGVNMVGDKDLLVARQTMLAWLDHIQMPFEHTRVRRTKNGWHFYYRRPVAAFALQSQKLDQLIPHLELLTGIGHQVVHTAPGYETVTDSVPAVFNMEWLPPITHSRSNGVEEWQYLPSGMRNDFLTSVGGKLREWGATQPAILDVLEHLNEYELETPLKTVEVEAITKSVMRYRPGSAREETCPECGTTWETM